MEPLTPRSTGQTPILVAVDVTKRYGRVTRALNAVSLEVFPGQIVGIVGPNGAGKSTLMKTWVGFEAPTSGWVRVAGIDPRADAAAALRHLGYVPQSPALYRELSVSRHLGLAQALRHDFDRELAERRLAELGIPLDRLAGQLSGGQAAQVHLCIALGTRAEALLLDEPLASLDPLARREFIDILTDEVRTRGVTAVLTSHVVADVERACDRLVVLGVGRKLLDATLALVAAQHRLLPDGEPPVHPGMRPIERVETLDRQVAWLVAVDPGLDVPAPIPTAEQVVLGYLLAGRRDGRERAA